MRNRMTVRRDILFGFTIYLLAANVDQCASTGRKELFSEPFANTPSGTLKGLVGTTWTNKKFYSFRGIPFAEPPVGNLRFKAPVTAKSWEGIKNAQFDAKICPQIESQNVGPADEDCLYLNVYTQKLAGDKPVIVYFHPGGFYVLTGASYWSGPEYLLDQDIVLVTANYRLDALGFLATGDRASSGNYGLKDQVEVLRWVQKHIKSFGGNPKKVTIAGYSAGATSGLLHMLSPMSKGLFQNVIAMSCGVTSNWVTMKDPIETSKQLAKLFNCSTDSSQKIVECLKKIPANEINNKYEQMKIFYGSPFPFAPTIEPDLGTGEERFLTDDPVTLIKKKQFYNVPVVIGYNKYEFVDWSQYVLNNDTLRKEFNDDFDSLAPKLFGYSRKSKDEAQRITNSLKKFYFRDRPITKSFETELSQLFSDANIYYGVHSSAKLLTKFSSKAVYFYKLDYKGRFGFVKDIHTNKTIGPTHLDDLIYLIYASKSFPLLKESDPEAFMVKYETSFWKNFATNGNPTPDRSPVKWVPMEDNHERYLKFDSQLKIEEGLPYPERMKLWESILPV